MNQRQSTGPRRDSATRHGVRKPDVTAVTGFDERWWPVTLLLLVSAGALAGYIWTASDFHSPVFYRNGWFHLGLVGATAVTLIVGVLMVRGSAERRLQLGIFLSLAFHVGLIFLSRKLYMELDRTIPRTVVGLDEERAAIPDYIPLQKPESNEVVDLTRPAAADVRREEKMTVTQRPAEKVDAEKDAVREPEPKVRPQPTPVDIRRVEPTAPRRSQVSAGPNPSQKQTPDKPRTDQAPQLPQLRAVQESRPNVTAQETMAQRQQAADTSPARLNVAAPLPVERPSAEPGQAMPRPSQLPDQFASIDTARNSPRRLSERMFEPTSVPEAGPAAPQATSQLQPSPAPSPAAEANRQTAESSSARPSQASLPFVTPAPSDNAAQSAPSRAESPDPSDAPSAPTFPGRPSRSTSNQIATAGADPQMFDLPSSPAAGASGPAQNDALQSAATGMTRGDHGLQRPQTITGLSEPAPLGQGPGSRVGSSFTGPQRQADLGEGITGSAAAAGIEGRTGRGRGRGMNSPLASLPGDMMPSFAGPQAQPGNAGSGPSGNLQPAPSSGGVGVGDRPAATGGISGRPATGMTAGTGLSGATELGANSSSGLGAGARRDLGDVAGDGTGAAGSGVGLAPRGRTGRGTAVTFLDGDAPGLVVGSPQGQPTGKPGSAGPLVAAADAGNLRQSATGAAVMIAAPEGPGALAMAMRPDVGLPDIRARVESDIVHPESSRFVPKRAAGKKFGGGSVREMSIPDYKQRDPAGRGQIAKLYGGTDAGEKAVELGLDFLARHQAADGSWRLHDFGNGLPGYEDAGLGNMESNTAGTGLALLAFLGAGYTHRDYKYDTVVEKGLGYLLRNQKSDGDLFVRPPGPGQPNTWLYSHGIATIALCEALGMTRDDELLREPAQRAINFIVSAQDPNYGGWRYLPRFGSDTSVSGWQLMALKSGERVGLVVPQRTYDMVTKWLDYSQGAAGDPTRYAYRPQARDEVEGAEEGLKQRRPSRVMTAEALLMRQYLGWNRDNAYLTGGADYLLSELPQLGTADSGERDSYYWYYGTQVMFHMKGEHWKRWNERLQPLLVAGQEREGALAGSWNPGGEIPDRWGPSGGRVYVTAMNLLMLEVYYRYLPLYQNLQE